MELKSKQEFIDYLNSYRRAMYEYEEISSSLYDIKAIGYDHTPFDCSSDVYRKTERYNYLMTKKKENEDAMNSVERFICESFNGEDCSMMHKRYVSLKSNKEIALDLDRSIGYVSRRFKYIIDRYTADHIANKHKHARSYTSTHDHSRSIPNN